MTEEIEIDPVNIMFNKKTIECNSISISRKKC